MSKIISAKKENRVWTRSAIAENSFFGPYRVDVTQLIKTVQVLDTPSTQFKASEERDFNEHDLLDGDFSWMSKVNPARFQAEQNMEAILTSDGDPIYFRTTRDIASGEELRVWLAPPLEEEHRMSHSRISEEKFKGYQWNCQNCQRTFQHSRAYSAHTIYGCSYEDSGITLRETTSDKSTDSDGLGPVNNARFTRENLPGQSKVKDSENDEKGVRSREYMAERQSPNDTSLRINGHSLATFDQSRVLSNPKLASLISSFSRPRFRKFANETQSLAEYHKQEFRKKFQGNEHYLRKHLYRENMHMAQMKCSTKYRRALMMQEDSEYSLHSPQDELHIKREKDELINCFSDDYIVDRHRSNAFIPSSPESEVFPNGNSKNALRHSFYDGHLPLNDSAFNSYSNITSMTGSKVNFHSVTCECPTSNGHGRLAESGEHSSREPVRECTCQHRDGSRDIPKPGKSGTVSKELEMNGTEEIAAEENEENQTTLRGELYQNICRSNQLNQIVATANVSRLGSYLAYQRMQQDVTFRQHLQCNCYSSMHEPTENLARYHEPAFLVDPMYRYSTYQRMLPFFGHHGTNPPQTSPRNQGFTCEYCGKVYCRKYVLKIHMRTHTGFKPLRCKVCDKSFSDPSNMKKHVKLHETEDTVHKCRHCGRNFVRYRGLLNHIKSKHSEHVILQ